MEEEIVEETNNKSGSLVMIIAIIAVVLAIFAGYLGFSTRTTLKHMQSDLANNENSRADIRDEFKNINSQLQALSKRFDGLATKVRIQGQSGGSSEQLRKQTQEGFDQLASVIKNNQEQVKKLEGELKGLVNNLQSGSVRRLSSGGSTTSSASYGTSNSSDSSAVSSSSGLDSERMYTIQKGDLLIRIAKRYNISVNDLLEANPNVDPTRLRIGQKVFIPLN